MFIKMKNIAAAMLVVGISCGWAATQAQEVKPLKETDVEQIAIKVAAETAQGGYKLLNVTQLKAMIDAKEDFVLVDAHPKWEFDLGYVAGATNFGFKSVRAGKWEDDQEVQGATQADYKAVLGKDPAKKIVIYCGFTKCGRSHNAAMWAKELGYSNVYRVPGGITAWKDAGFDYKTNKPAQ